MQPVWLVKKVFRLISLNIQPKMDKIVSFKIYFSIRLFLLLPLPQLRFSLAGNPYKACGAVLKYVTHGSETPTYKLLGFPTLASFPLLPIDIKSISQKSPQCTEHIR